MVLTTRRQARLQEADASNSGVGNVEGLPLVNETKEVEENNNAASSSESSSSSEDDDSDSESSEDSDTDSSSGEEEDLDQLFEISLQACKAKDLESAASKTNSGFETNADEVRFAGEQEKGVVGRGVTAALNEKDKKDHKGKGRETAPELESHFERLKRGDELGQNRPKSESQQKRERQKEKEKTAGSKWFDLPAFPKSFAGKKGSITKGNANIHSSGPTAEEMKREIQAIRLRNAMDPKRFYRGGNGAGDKSMPAYAQMGRIISSNLEPASTLTRSERGRTVIDELVKDAQNANYTKRKFNEQQARTDVGRSSHISKRKGGNAGKRQRR